MDCALEAAEVATADLRFFSWQENYILKVDNLGTKLESDLLTRDRAVCDKITDV
jgi:hypothetical protein